MTKRRSYRSLREYLSVTGTTQEALAARVGTQQSVISRAMRGAPVSRKLALRLHQETGVPLTALLYPDVERASA